MGIMLPEDELKELSLEQQVNTLREIIYEMSFVINSLENRLNQFIYDTNSTVNEIDDKVGKSFCNLNILETELQHHIDDPHAILITSKKEGDKK